MMVEVTTTPDGSVRMVTDDPEVLKSLLASGMWHLILTGDQIKALAEKDR